MAVLQRKLQWMSEDEYLANERHEFLDGERFAMAGRTRWHNRLAGRMFSALSEITITARICLSESKDDASRTVAEKYSSEMGI